MIVVDANLLLYAYDLTSPPHARARAWLETALSGDMLVGLPWQSITAFLRITTNPRLPGNRFTTEEALTIIESWLRQPNVRALSPGERHWSVLRQVALEGQAAGPLLADAHLAAITMEYGGVLHTTDRDFARFPGLRWTNPLA